MKLTKDELKKIADLARIELTDVELERFASELSQILDYANQLKEVDTSDIDYASHIADFVGDSTQRDEPGPKMDKEDTFKNSDKRKKGSHFFTSNIQ